MSLTIELPLSLENELATQATRWGLTPTEHATLLLLLAKALSKDQDDSIFSHAAKDALTSQALDPSLNSRAFKVLLSICSRDREGRAEAKRFLAEVGGDSEDQIPDAAARTLGQWKGLTVRLSPLDPEKPIDDSVDVSVTEMPAVDRLVQEGRRSARGNYSWMSGGSEEFARRKEAEKAIEERHWK